MARKKGAKKHTHTHDTTRTNKFEKLGSCYCRWLCAKIMHLFVPATVSKTSKKRFICAFMLLNYIFPRRFAYFALLFHSLSLSLSHSLSLPFCVRSPTRLMLLSLCSACCVLFSQQPGFDCNIRGSFCDGM